MSSATAFSCSSGRRMLNLMQSGRASFCKVLGHARCSMCRSSYRWHFCLALVTSLLLAGCRQQMAEQPSYRPLDASNFFPDGRSARPVVPDTVSREQTLGDSPLETGKSNGQDLTTVPIPLTQAVLTRGQQRYNIYCALCHDRVGTGQGVVVRRGYTQP